MHQVGHSSLRGAWRRQEQLTDLAKLMGIEQQSSKAGEYGRCHVGKWQDDFCPQGSILTFWQRSVIEG